MAEQRVFFFGGGKAEGNAKMKELLGGKGANLAEMTSLGVPVPPGFTIATKVCREYYKSGGKWPGGLEKEVDKNLAKLEKAMDAKLGDPNKPLLVSVRSGAAVSMPGMMDTVLNLGLNDDVIEGIIKKTKNARFAYDIYRRFIDMFGDVVMGCSHEYFEEVIHAAKEKAGVKLDNELKADQLKEVVEKYKAVYKKHVGELFPQDGKLQLKHAINAVFGSWMTERAVKYRHLNKIAGLLGTAVNVQAMVFGNMGNDCGTGVCFTRNPSTGKKEFYGEFLMNAQGEDVVAGIRTPLPLIKLSRKMPKAYKQLTALMTRLEKHYKDMQDMEFTIQNKVLYILQTRTGKRTAEAAVKVAVDMVNERLIPKKEAVNRVTPEQLDRLLHPSFDPKAKRNVIAKGLPASPGAAVGQVVFTADTAEAWNKKGKKVILVRIETSPEDIGGMDAAEGILTERGGMTSHAAVVARGMGKCCVAGVSALIRQMILAADDYAAMLTKIETAQTEKEKNAIRKEYAVATKEFEGALKKLLPYQRSDFEGIFTAMAGLPVTIRLLDPPLHEFLPQDSKSQAEMAKRLKVKPSVVKAKVEQLHEFNPMLGHRGCRLSISYPAIGRMQARAIIEAALNVKKKGKKVLPEIMIPLVGAVAELKMVKDEIVDEIKQVFKERKDRIQYMVGTMIEVPRAALTADEVAKEAEFFSFGTNDLTQMTMGFSRDDAGKFLGEYVRKGIYAADPFQQLDQSGVGKLVEMGTKLGRKTRKKLKVGICGEHGGEPSSIDFCHRVGMNYVSCSPFRVPIARLAAAQAATRD